MLLKLGLAPTLVISSEEAAQEIMRTHDHRFASRPVTSEVAKLVLGGNLDVVFAPYGEYWRQLRKICVTRLLSAKMVQSFRRVREEEVVSLISKISSQSTTGDGVVNMSGVLTFFTNAIVCKAISSRHFVDEARTKTICELVETNSAILGTPTVEDFFPALRWLDELTGLRGKARRVGSRWGRVLDEIIEGHAHRPMEMMEEDNSPDRDFIDVLLALEREGTNNIEFSFNREIGKSLLEGMIAAGTETSFVALDWCMAELLRNPHSMNKLQVEVRNIA